MDLHEIILLLVDDVLVVEQHPEQEVVHPAQQHLVEGLLSVVLPVVAGDVHGLHLVARLRLVEHLIVLDPLHVRVVEGAPGLGLRHPLRRARRQFQGPILHRSRSFHSRVLLHRLAITSTFFLDIKEVITVLFLLITIVIVCVLELEDGLVVLRVDLVSHQHVEVTNVELVDSVMIIVPLDAPSVTILSYNL